MKIGVLGCGYVGIVNGVCLAHLNHHVICADISKEKIATLNSGGLPIWEQNLEEILQKVQERKIIQFTTDIAYTIRNSDVILVAVGTPPLPNDSADLSYLWASVDEIIKHINNEKLIVIKSTIPVGTSDSIETYLKQNSVGEKVLDVVHNPEFLRQGNAVHDFLHPDRIVIGYQKEEARQIMTKIYSELSATIQFCDRRSAELIKYASNGFLAMKISYINMMARLSDKLGADIDQVARGMGSDRRIGSQFLKAGIGYGGSCFPKDTKALLAMGEKMDCDLPLIDSTLIINDSQPGYLFAKLEEQLNNLKGKQVTLLGLTYKAMTDDIRESPSLELSRLLLDAGSIVRAYDPLVRKYPIPEVQLMSNVKQAIYGSDAVVIVTDWDEFKDINIPNITRKMNTPYILDGRNLFSLDQMKKWARETNLHYISIGRPIIKSDTKYLTKN